MKHLSRSIVLCAAITLVLTSTNITLAGSATWNLNPSSGDWNTAGNWTPNTVLNAASDTATFGVSNTTSVNVSAATIVDSIVFNAGASPYNISTSVPFNGLTIEGAGIVNQSGITQNFVALADTTGTQFGSSIEFLGDSTAGDMTSIVAQGAPVLHSSSGASVSFSESSSAGNASLIAGKGRIPGQLSFDTNATAANAVITVQGGGADPSNVSGLAYFYGNSTAAQATIINEGGSGDGAIGGQTTFLDTSSGGTAMITNKAGSAGAITPGRTFFQFSANADKCTVINEGSSSRNLGGVTDFMNTATAGNGVFIANTGTAAGGAITFEFQSSGGTARIEIFGKGTLNVWGHLAPGMTIGSLEGDGVTNLGERNLTIGSNNLSTTYSGPFREKVGGAGASLTKIGSGTLTLAGDNTYSAGTSVSQGALLVTNTTGSGTGAGPVQVDAGTFGGTGTVSGPVTIGNGTPGAYLAPGKNGPGTLTLNSALTFKTGSGYKCELGLTGHPKADQVIAHGVIIESGARFNLRTKFTGTLSVGTSLMVISNTAATAISGTFSNLADGSTFVAGNNTFQVSYEGGDGNDLTLTVIE